MKNRGMHFTREELAEAGVSGFFAIVKEWGLSQEESRTLLGNISHGRFDALQMGDPTTLSTLSDDELDRLAYITGIYAALNSLYTPASHSEWLRNKSRLSAEAMYRPWGTGSPLDFLLTGKFIALADVYAHLNSIGGVS